MLPIGVRHCLHCQMAGVQAGHLVMTVAFIVKYGTMPFVPDAIKIKNILILFIEHFFRQKYHSRNL